MAGTDSASSTASVTTAVGAAGGSWLTKFTRLLAQMVLRAQLALMAAAGDPTAAHATGTLRARPALLPHGRRRSAKQASAEVLRPRRRRGPHGHGPRPLQHCWQNGPHPEQAVDARLAGSTQCTVGGFIGLHAFGSSSPKLAYVIQTTDDGLFLPGRGRLPHQHHCGRGPGRSSEDKTDLI